MFLKAVFLFLSPWSLILFHNIKNREELKILIEKEHDIPSGHPPCLPSYVSLLANIIDFSFYERSFKITHLVQSFSSCF